MTQITEEMQSKISRLLASNTAVGIVSGYFDEDFTVNFISDYALNIIGYTYEEFINATNNHVLNIIYEPDRESYKGLIESLKDMNESGEHSNGIWGEYRVVNKQGNPVWIQDMRTVCRDENGEKIWISSVRMTDDIKNLMDRQAAELQCKIESANSANEAKTKFLSALSHDIRTPMNSIIGMTDIAKCYIDDKEKVRDCLEKISVSSRHLLSLINDILDISTIEAKEVNVRTEPVDIPELFAELESIIMPQILDRKHDFSIDMSGISHTCVYGDKLKLHQIFINIVSNAVKYTPNGGKIRISAREEEDGRYIFNLSDNGIGMSQEFISRVFLPYARHNDEKALCAMGLNAVKGTGLGMLITQKLVHLLGGEITVESELGRGTRFTVILNMECAENAEVERRGREHRTDEMAVKTPKFLDFHGKRILLVDDKEMNREVAREILKMMNLCVDEAKDGGEAVEMYRENPHYDLILMDIQMPVMDGYSATREIRSMDGGNVPIVAMTANAFSQDVKASKSVGMNDHVSKPIDIEKLQTVVAKWV
jgi:PAS domain S-box-containing protein